MRKLALILVAMIPFFASCEKADTLTERTITLDYTLQESGSMSRSVESLYLDFYNKYIVTRKYTPTKYNLTFKNTADNSTISITDRWSAGHALKLLTGTYKVIGTSAPEGKITNGSLDTLSLRFEQEVVINQNTTKINLSAIYDSFMIFFDAEDVSQVRYCEDGYHAMASYFKNIDNIYYAFFPSLNTDDYLQLTRTNGGEATVNIGKMTFEKGKYYYFGDTETGYDLPSMTPGN